MKPLPVALDAMDRRILDVLQQDGRITIAALADSVGLSATPCLRRVKRLEEEGVITGYAAVIEPKRVGLGLDAFVQVSLRDHAEEDVRGFEKTVMACPEIVAYYVLTGDIDYLLRIRVTDLDAYSEFATKTLLRMPGVRDTKTSFVLKVGKETQALDVVTAGN
jgi:Lrp/AsnC family leucine-responsive transcriptional regulator